ncbi:hypothetical protein D3C71_1694560 [compost metagenome]
MKDPNRTAPPPAISRRQVSLSDPVAFQPSARLRSGLTDRLLSIDMAWMVSRSRLRTRNVGLIVTPTVRACLNLRAALVNGSLDPT